MEKIDINHLNDICEDMIVKGELPLGCFFIKQVKIRKTDLRRCECNFYNTKNYLVGSFYKPISFRPKNA